MPDTKEMLKKVKERLDLTDKEEHDAVLLQMLEDAIMAIMLYCNRKIFPWQLEHIARAMVVNEFYKSNGENCTSIKRGDTQITYATTITEESMTQEQRDICNKFRHFRVR